mgnify:CR=1 FL=1
MHNIQIDEAVLIIRVSKLYHSAISDIELYEITRGVWKVSGSRRESVEFVFSVYQGVVKEVYKVNSWCPALTTLYQTRTKKDITLNGEIEMDGRWEFLGEVAEQNIRGKYINKSVAFIFSQGSSNPVKYINC